MKMTTITQEMLSDVIFQHPITVGEVGSRYYGFGHYMLLENVYESVLVHSHYDEINKVHVFSSHQQAREVFAEVIKSFSEYILESLDAEEGMTNIKNDPRFKFGESIAKHTDKFPSSKNLNVLFTRSNGKELSNEDILFIQSGFLSAKNEQEKGL